MIGGSGEKKTLRTVARYADMWNAMGEVDFLRRKIDVLRRHCDEVGRDFAEIELTAGCKPIIRNTEAEAHRVWEAQMAHNRTPMADVVDDDTFWVGTPDLIAERMLERKALGLPHVHRGDGPAVRRRVPGALDRRGPADGRPRVGRPRTPPRGSGTASAGGRPARPAAS